jgi:hypothetical protein
VTQAVEVAKEAAVGGVRRGGAQCRVV